MQKFNSIRAPELRQTERGKRNLESSTKASLHAPVVCPRERADKAKDHPQPSHSIALTFPRSEEVAGQMLLTDFTPSHQTKAYVKHKQLKH